MDKRYPGPGTGHHPGTMRFVQFDETKRFEKRCETFLLVKGSACRSKMDSHFLVRAAERENYLFSYINEQHTFGLDPKIPCHVWSCKNLPQHQIFVRLDEDMTSCVPHWDSVFLHFQSVKPWRSLIMKGLSLFQRTASRLIWLRYVCQDGGTVSKAYIFYERSLIWLNNLTIPQMKVSSPPQLMWLSLCLNKITQMDCAIFVLPWFSFFFIINSCLPFFPNVLYICCGGGRKVAFPSILGRSDNHMGKADSALCIVWNHRSQGSFLECWGWPRKSILQNQR